MAVRKKQKNPITNKKLAKELLSQELLESEQAVLGDAFPEVGEDFDISHLYHPQAKYTPEDKMRAVMAYVTTGTSTEAAKISGMTAQLIRDWKKRAPWWPEAMAQARKMKSEELDGLLTKVIHQATESIVDRLTNGDIHVSLKDGEIYRAPISASKIATIMGIAWDKRNLQRGEFDTRGGSKSTEEHLEQLKKKFEEFAKTQEEKQANVVATSHREN